MTDRSILRKTGSIQSALPFWRQLGTRLTLAFVLLGLLPVLVVTLVILNRTGSQAKDQVYNQLDSVAELKSDQILRWLDQGNLAMDTLLSGPNSQRFADFTSSQTSGFQEQDEISGILAGAVEPEYFKRMFIYNESGVIVASSDPAYMRKSIKEQPYFEISLHADYIQSPLLDPATQQLVMYITRPLRSGKIQAAGVLVGELNIDTLADIMTERTGLGSSGETYLVSLQNNNLLTPSRFTGYQMNAVYHSNGIDQGLEGIKGRGAYNSYRSVTVFGSYRFIPELQAALLAEVEESQALVAYRQAQWVGILIAVISALAATAVGFFTSGSISRPVRDLTVSAQRIGSGELKAQVGELRRTDEIGVLANAFQKMQSELVASYEKLEQRVAARTKDLATVARISTAVATIQDPFEMLANTVHLTQRGFNLYHAHVFVYRKDTDDLQIVACGYKEGDEHEGTHGTAIIPVSQEQSLVARAARTRQPVIVNDVRSDPSWLPNPLLPDTHSELAVPMVVGDELLGVLDVQSEHMDAFSEESANIQMTLASQVATALQNARSLDKTRKQAELESLANRIGQKIQRTTSLEDTLQTAVREIGLALGASRVSARIAAHTDGGNNASQN